MKSFITARNPLAKLFFNFQILRFAASGIAKWTIKQVMAKKSKGNRIQVILECTEHKNSGLQGTSRYVTQKNRKNTPDRMELKKYNPIMRKYTVHREIK